MAVDAHQQTQLAGSPEETKPSGTGRRRPHPGERVGVGTVVAGRYQVVQLVGEGAFGSVYRADDLDVPGHKVALKLMHRPPASTEERERCLREVRLIAAVEHPSVVSFKDHGWHRQRFYIVMPWYDGVTLGQRLKQRPEGLSRAEAQFIFERLAEALDAMHARGVRHQDIKPDNILLARFGEGQQEVPVLLDLGVGADEDEHVMAFTPAYVAPEMARAHICAITGDPVPVLDGRADVYSLALTLWDALCPGQRTIGSDSGSPAGLASRAKTPVTLPFGRDMNDLRPSFGRWLSVDPDERPTARDFRQQLAVLTRRQRRRLERTRAAYRWGPALLAFLTISVALYGKLHVEKDRSRTKDAQLLAQAAQIDRTREALDVLADEHVAERAAHRALRDDNAEKAQLIAELEDRTRQLVSEQAAARRKTAETRAVRQRLTDRVGRLEEALTASDTEREGLLARLARSEQSRRRLADSRKRLKAEHEAMTQQLQAQRVELARLSEATEALLVDKRRMDEELSRLKDRRAAELAFDEQRNVDPVPSPTL